MKEGGGGRTSCSTPTPYISLHFPISPYISLSPGGDPSCAPRFMRPWALGAAEDAGEHAGEEEPPLFNVSAGRIVLFPAWLQHYVPPHCGEGARVSVAFNVAATVPGRLNPDGQLHAADPADTAQAAPHP